MRRFGFGLLSVSIWLTPSFVSAGLIYADHLALVPISGWMTAALVAAFCAAAGSFDVVVRTHLRGWDHDWRRAGGQVMTFVIAQTLLVPALLGLGIGIAALLTGAAA